MSPAAEAWARNAARKLLSNRAGHGGDKSHGVGYRVMREADLIALAALAFDEGAEHERNNPGQRPTSTKGE